MHRAASAPASGCADLRVPSIDHIIEPEFETVVRNTAKVLVVRSQELRRRRKLPIASFDRVQMKNGNKQARDRIENVLEICLSIMRSALVFRIVVGFPP